MQRSPVPNSAPAWPLALALLLAWPAAASGAPDEVRLGRDQGYPAGHAGNWFFDESVRVGSFSAQAEIPGLANGVAHTLAPSAQPMPLPRADAEPALRWAVGGERGLTIDDFLARQRIMALIVVKDGVVQLERYQYGRTPQHRFVSHSMAKSILSLAVGMALAEGRIESLDDPAGRYAPRLAGTLLGGTPLRDLLRMASGARCSEEYTGQDDAARFAREVARRGTEQAAAVIADRDVPAGERFSYCSAQSAVLGAALHRAVGTSLAEYLTPRLWQAIGAEHPAAWRADRNGIELAGGHFNATLRDYARLGVVLAYDGRRPDRPEQPPIVPLPYLLEATDWALSPPAFRPGTATPTYGYGLHFWTLPGRPRRFALLGVYGQAMYVDPQLRLVMVQLAANATAKAGQTSLARESQALWRALVAHYGR